MFGIVIVAILIWIVAPFVELGIIVTLTKTKVENEKKIAQLSQALEEQKSMRTAASPPQGTAPELMQPGMPVRVVPGVYGSQETPPGSISVMTVSGSERQSRAVFAGHTNTAGLAALIIGMVFIVLAGLIFATTTWNVLPDFCKVALVFLLTGVFFGASYLAEKKLHIHKTGNGFYILGSIFSFFTVLAAGYYRFLGPAFILEGVNRYRVLWIGSLVTVGIWFLGLKRFRDRLFTEACLWGLTVSMMFLTASFSLGYRGLTGTMMVYAFCLLILEQILQYKNVWNHMESTDSEETSTAGCIRMLTEEMKYFVPIHFWLFAAVSVSCGVLENFYIMDRGGFTLLSLAVALAGTVFFCYRERTLFYQCLFFLLFADFLYYIFLLWVFPGREIYGCLIIEGIFTLFFFVYRKIQRKIQKVGFLWNETAGNIICTTFICINTLVIVLLSSLGDIIAWEQLAASGAVIMCTAILHWWSKTCSLVKNLALLTAGYLTVTFYRMLQLQAAGCPEHRVFAAIYLSAVLVWAFIKRQDCWIPVLMIGLLSQVDFFPGAGLIVLWGLSAAVDRKWGRESPQVELTGISLFMITAVAFYRDSSMETGTFWLYYLLSLFFYLVFYRGRRSWLSAFPALALLFAPLIYLYRYEITREWLYGIVAAALLLTGTVARLFLPIVKQDEKVEGGWRIDFYHGLSILLLIYLLLEAKGNWMFVYMVLLGGYWFQYATVRGVNSWELIRKISFTVGGFHLLWAFWIQPFIDWPPSLTWKVSLAGMAVYLWIQTYIWKKSEVLWNLQTVGYGLCLGGLVLEGLFTGRVLDALILEGICLIIFVCSIVKTCVRWRRISGILIVTVVLYMTKDFWFSISWWIYLLAAGTGLLLFAAFSEKKKK